MSWWLITLEISYVVLILFTSYRIIADTRSSTKSLAYLLTVIFVPVVGIIIYFSVGINYKKRQIYSKKIIVSGSLQAILIQWMHERNIKAIVDDTEEVFDKRIPQFLFHTNRSPFTNNNLIQLLRNGEEKFPKAFEAIANAKKTIHIEYYIMEEGRLTEKLEKLLIKKVKEGVAIRIIYDDFGSSSIRKKIVTRWRKHGIAIYPFYKIKLLLFANRINYRNHRKLIIIDGEIGFTGGINWSDRYYNQNEKDLYWRDTHLYLEGPIVASLQAVFLADWNFCSNIPIKPTLDLFKGLNNKPGNTSAQIAAGGPDYATPTILYSLLQAIHSAKQYIYITTPYYIPDESLQNALCLMAQSGVDVRLLIPYKSDSKVVDAASRSYFKELLYAGVKIYRYQKGFIHAKTLTIDSQLSTVGTANLDYRSFDLNFEVNAIVYDMKVSQDLRKQFEEDLLLSEEVRLGSWLQRNKIRVFFEKIAGLISPLL